MCLGFRICRTSSEFTFGNQVFHGFSEGSLTHFPLGFWLRWYFWMVNPCKSICQNERIVKPSSSTNVGWFPLQEPVKMKRLSSFLAPGRLISPLTQGVLCRMSVDQFDPFDPKLILEKLCRFIPTVMSHCKHFSSNLGTQGIFLLRCLMGFSVLL